MEYNQRRFIIHTPEECTTHPEKVKGKATKKMLEPTFSGTIVLRRPDFDQRTALVEEMGVTFNADGEANMETSGLQIIRKMIASSRPYYEKVDLVRLSDGEKFESFDDLSFDPECDMILVGAATALTQKKTVSKN